MSHGQTGVVEFLTIFYPRVFFTHTVITVTVIYNFNLTANSTLVLPYDVV